MDKEGLPVVKHAFLIMAHNQFPLLKKLLSQLDHPDHMIFLHIDSRSYAFQEEDIRSVLRFSRLTLIDRKPIIWGGYSQIDCEMRLLKAARGCGADYYHLLSGTDMAIKPMDVIHSFF